MPTTTRGYSRRNDDDDQGMRAGGGYDDDDDHTETDVARVLSAEHCSLGPSRPRPRPRPPPAPAPAVEHCSLGPANVHSHRSQTRPQTVWLLWQRGRAPPAPSELGEGVGGGSSPSS